MQEADLYKFGMIEPWREWKTCCLFVWKGEIAMEERLCSRKETSRNKLWDVEPKVKTPDGALVHITAINLTGTDVLEVTAHSGYPTGLKRTFYPAFKRISALSELATQDPWIMIIE